jgi:hypothetical protein
MTTKATDVLQRVVWLLQDESIRWTAAELVQWLNDGQTAMVALRPDVTETITTFNCVPGALQSLYDNASNLPEPPVKLMKVTRNVSVEGRFRAVRLVSREIMDVTRPDWQSAPPATDCVNYMVDENLPAAFWVYPPAPDPSIQVPAMMVEIHYSAEPKKLDLPAADKTWKDTQGDLSVRDRFAMVLVDYVLYRAFMKDAEFGGNGARSKTHFDLFQGQLMADVQGTMVAQPKAKAAAA